MSSASQSEEFEKPLSRFYFYNFWIDFLFIGGGSIAFYAFVWFFWSNSSSTDAQLQAASLLVWVGNWPHFSATNYRLYHSKENIRQYPLTAGLVPLIMLGLVAASFASPDVIAPYFVKLFSIWSPFHFSGQTVGITLIYLRRSGIKLELFERRALISFVYGCFLYQTMFFETNPSGYAYYGITYPGFGLPMWIVTLTGCFVAISGMYLAGCYFRWFKEKKADFTVLTTIPPLAQLVWFVIGGQNPSYVIFVPFFHSVQYILIAWAMQLIEAGDANRMKGKHYLTKETLRWGSINIAGGAILFYALPRIFSSAGWPLSFSLGVVTAAVQIHHFFVDGVIWKLRRQSVVQPLLANIPEHFERISQMG